MSHDPSSPHDPEAGPYVVGPRRPPRHTRFKPGQSGNPRGRPKQTLTRAALSAILAEALLETTVTLTKGGQQSRISVLQAAVSKQAHLALSGDTKAFASLLALAERVASYEAGTASNEDDARADQLILQRGLDAEAPSSGLRSRDLNRQPIEGRAGNRTNDGSRQGRDVVSGYGAGGEAGDA